MKIRDLEKGPKFKALEYHKWYVGVENWFIKVREFSLSEDKVSGATVNRSGFLRSDYWSNPDIRRDMVLVTDPTRLEWLAAIEEQDSYITFESFKFKTEDYPVDSYILFLKARGSVDAGSILRISSKDSTTDMLPYVSGYGPLDIRDAEEKEEIKGFETKALAEEYWPKKEGKDWFIECTKDNHELCREFQNLQKDWGSAYTIDINSMLLSNCPVDTSYYTSYKSDLTNPKYKGYKEISTEELQKIVNDLKGVPTAVAEKAKETVYEWKLKSMENASAKKNQIKGVPLFEVKERGAVIK